VTAEHGELVAQYEELDLVVGLGSASRTTGSTGRRNTSKEHMIMLTILTDNAIVAGRSSQPSPPNAPRVESGAGEVRRDGARRGPDHP
jgi:hypothetical protein